MIRKIHHIGIAVRSISESLPLYRDVLKLDLKGIEEVKGDGVKVAFLKVGETKIELLEPIDKDSPVSKFLEKRGEGFHHICFEVDNVRNVLEGCKNSGIVTIDEKPRKGAENCMVAFLHPKSCNGVLVELAEVIIDHGEEKR